MTLFSDRLPWDTPRNAYSLLLQEKRRPGERLLDLTIANPTEAFSDYPHPDIARAYGAIADFRYEPHPFGAPQARQTIADWYAAHKLAVTAERIALTASTSEAYSVLFKLLCDPGDELLIPCPSYPLFEYLARAEAVKTVPYQLRYDGSWFIDFDSVRAAITSRTRAIVVVNPNNPTGSFLKESELRQWAAFGLPLISDEVFMTYPSASGQPDRVSSLIHNQDLLSFSLNGLSKAAGMPQMKLAWIVVNGPASERAMVLGRLELLLDNYLSVSTPVQQALPDLLARIGADMHKRITERICQNRAALKTLQGSAIEPLMSEAGWSAILQIPNVRSEQDWITRLLAEDGVVMQPGYFYDMAKEAFVVVSLLTKQADFSEGIHKLKQRVERG